mmetsp:Transcript_32689/g.92738  ORF Transcript_32689/g.92738 Transcript_32689/m.92738 type:complete len:986 (+) Transcript_32689:227-3184(+)
MRKHQQHGSGDRPLFWDSKIYGTPYGDFNRGAPQPAKHSHGRRTVEVTPGVREPLPAKPTPGNAPHHKPTAHHQAQLARLEERMRKQLTAHSAMHKVERTVLLNAFAKVLRVPKIAVQQKVSTEQFMRVWHSLGIETSNIDAATVFNKYGQDKDGQMPVMVFVEGLLLGQARYIVKRSDKLQRRNPFKAGEKADFMGEILYPQCRKGVFAPSDWDPRQAERSATLPDVDLSLEFVYGYSGLLNTAPNLFYVNEDEVIYYTAGVGVKYNRRMNTQCFFLKHNDDIHCMAYSPARCLAATGQVGAVGKNCPKVCIWEPLVWSPDGTVNHAASGEEMRQKLVIEFPKADRGITAVGFSPCGKKLVTVAMDNSHTMYIWNIGKGCKKVQRQGEDGGDALIWSKTTQGAPPATYGVVWNPFDDTQLLTYGLKYIKFFTLTTDAKGGVALKGSAGLFGNPNKLRAKMPDSNAKTSVHTITAACYLSTTTAVTGNANGEICTWKRMKSGSWALKHTTRAHQKGSKERCVDGSLGFSGVRVLCLRSDNKALLSGGADGMVISWAVSADGIESTPQLVMPVALPSQLQQGEQPPKITALDCLPGTNVFIVGTKGCDIYEVDEDPEMLIEGHSADVYGLAMSPHHPHIFATASDCTKVAIWDSSRCRNLRLVEVGKVARSVAWSPDGRQLAIGCRDGGLKVLQFFPDMQQVFWAQVATSAIDDLKYSPCGSFLAVASHDQMIDIFNVSKGYAKVGRCSGHSSTVTHLDWSQDSKVIRSTDTARELLYFNARTCKQVRENQRDTKWASWTCVQGFPVMGIWKNTSDTTDINACDRSPCGQYLVAVDDSGMTRLYNYPCVVEKAPSKDYVGHSSHVMNARFSSDGRHVVTVGGHDRAVFQWRVKKQIKHAPPPLVAPWVHLGGNQWAPQDDGAVYNQQPLQGHERHTGRGYTKNQPTNSAHHHHEEHQLYGQHDYHARPSSQNSQGRNRSISQIQFG